MEAADHGAARRGDHGDHGDRPGHSDVATPRDAAARGERVLGLIDDDGLVVGWVRGAEELVGLTADRAVGRRAEFFLGPDEGLTVSAFAARAGCSRGWARQVRTPHGETCVLELCRLSGRAGSVSWMLSAPGAVPGQGLQPRAAAGRLPTGRAVWDPALRCAWVNDVLDEHDCIPRVQRLGSRASQTVPGFDAEALEAVMRNVLSRGAPALGYHHDLRDEANPSRDCVFAVSLFRLEAQDGSVLGVCSLSVDVTRELRQRERRAVLGEAWGRIGTTRDLMRTAQELAEFTVPLIADYVTVDLAESVQLGEEPLALLSPDGERIPVFRRAGVASIHPNLPEALFQRGQPVFVPPSSPFTDVLTTGRSHFQPVLDTWRDEWFKRDPDRARVVRATGMHTLMIVPVREGDAVLGIAVFVRNENPAPFEREDLQTAEELVAQTARQLNDQRSYSHERHAALALQRNLLPHNVRGGPGLDVASHYAPADMEDGVGGDWFDVIAMSGSRTALVIGDVVGHGIVAAAAMGRLRTAVRTLAYMAIEPDDLFARVDKAVMSFAEGDESDDATVASITGATCLMVVYDPHTRRAVAASAGHPPLLIVDPDGNAAFIRLPAGAPLGYGLSSYERVEFELAEGSLIVLFTDGLVEERGSDIDTGMNRLAATLARPGLSLRELSEAAFDARPDDLTDRAGLQLRPPTDDATLLLARTRSISLEEQEAAAREAR